MIKNPSPRSTKIFSKETLHFYWQATWKHKKLFFLSLLLPLGAVFTNVLAPFFASKVLANLIHDNNQTQIYFILFGSMAILGLIFNKIGITNNMRLQANVMSDLHNTVIERLLKRSAGFYTNHIGGKLVSDTIDFVNAYSALSVHGFIKGVGLLCITIVGLVLLTLSSWQMGVCVLIILLILTVWTFIDSKRRLSVRAERLEITRRLIAHLSDSIVNALTVKTFAQESKETSRSQHLGGILRDKRAKDWAQTTSDENYRVGTVVIMQIVLIYMLIHLVQSDPSVLSAGIFAFTYSLTLLGRFFEINTIVRQVDDAFLNASPMTEILLEDIEIADAPGAKAVKIKDGNITLSDISFTYSDSSDNDAIFDKLSMKIKSGEKIGLVGHSGSGKSTLTKLLLRFDDPSGGSILIDGQDIKQATQESLRAHIAYVPQEPLLFHRSIMENIRYGKNTATKEEVIQAAQLAYATEFIDKLPQGYDTIVGERGVKLSGGQRQRIAIARAILKDAPILILDEATSALDSQSEILIQKALWELMKGRTTLVIAHRLSTIQKMDRIIVMEDGVITEQGTHKQLLKRNGNYAKLWSHQSGGFIEE